MNNKPNKKQFYWKVLIALLEVVWGFFTFSKITSFASNVGVNSPDDLVRAEMLKIAYLYAVLAACFIRQRIRI